MEDQLIEELEMALDEVEYEETEAKRKDIREITDYSISL